MTTLLLQTTSLLASQLDISTADTMVLSDGTILPLTGSTFFNSGNTKQVNKQVVLLHANYCLFIWQVLMKH
jgi:hypothetical protein